MQYSLPEEIGSWILTIITLGIFAKYVLFRKEYLDSLKIKERKKQEKREQKERK